VRWKEIGGDCSFLRSGGGWEGEGGEEEEGGREVGREGGAGGEGRREKERDKTHNGDEQHTHARGVTQHVERLDKEHVITSCQKLKNPAFRKRCSTGVAASACFWGSSLSFAPV